MRISPHHDFPLPRGGGLRGFTMVEIALSIAIIAVALIAIAGVLPVGLRVQEENREDTIMEDNGTYWLETLRAGAQGTLLFPEHVEQITISNSAAGQSDVYRPTPNAVDDPTWTSPRLIGLLSTPKWLHFQPNLPFQGTNRVTAIVRSMSGASVEQASGLSEFAFRYRMTVELMPYSSVFLRAGTSALVSDLLRAGQAGVEERNRQLQLERNLYELRLTFQWPVVLDATGGIVREGERRQVFSTLVAGSLDRTNALYYLRPTHYKPLLIPNLNP